MKRKHLLLGGCIIAVAVGAYVLLQQDLVDEAAAPADGEGVAMVDVQVPPLKGDVARGKLLFDRSCARCHGRNAAGNEGAGPPLIHVIYEPGHHSDEAIRRAVAVGVRRHHWRFGDMPPVPGLKRDDVRKIIAYIRELQRANGIR